jgi:hypothetical protein
MTYKDASEFPEKYWLLELTCQTRVPIDAGTADQIAMQINDGKARVLFFKDLFGWETIVATDKVAMLWESTPESREQGVKFDKARKAENESFDDD